MASVILFAGVPVTDIAAGRAWYERLFGRPPDLVPHEREVAWQLAEAGWIYVVEDLSRAGSALVTLVVEDLDEQVVAVEARGIAPVLRNEGSVRKAEFIDQDGNKVIFGQPPPSP